MEKLIDDIIELVIDDVDCHHEVDHEEDGTHTSVEYSLKDEVGLRSKIASLLKKEVTEEWIELRANELLRWWDAGGFVSLKPCKDFIRKIVDRR